MSKLAHSYAPTMLELDRRAMVDAGHTCHCPLCGGEVAAEEISLEAFEYAGRIICIGCFDEAVERDAEDNSQFGMGA